MSETWTDWALRLSDGRLMQFRDREKAVEHLTWMRKMRRGVAELVSRDVVATDWESGGRES